MRLRLALILALLAAVACGGSSTTKAPPTPPAPATAVAPTPPPTELDESLTLDPLIRIGKLDNGLTYYIVKHGNPSKRAHLWLGVNAGSISEDDDQLGLAHFVEHMAFNGTKKYKKMAIVNYLESIGMKFGPDVNAYTSFDETVYMLQVPTDDPKIMTAGFDILHEWAGSVAFDPTEIDKERGVVLEEWRLGRGAWKRVLDQQYPVLFHGARYADRLPIGSDSIIKEAPHAALTRFYSDWYRPDLMVVVAVGDFDPEAVEAEITQTFSDLSGPQEARPRELAEVPSHDGTLVSVVTDAEMPQTVIQVHTKLPHRRETTVGDYRRLVLEQLYGAMLSARLDELRQSPDAPFMFAGASIGAAARTADSFQRIVVVKEGRVEEALSMLVEEELRVVRHGFTAGELERAKKTMLRGYQQSAAERDKKDGNSIAAEILRNYFTGEMMPGIDAELALCERFMGEISLEELNSLGKVWAGSDSRVILISGPATMTKPADGQVLAWVEAVSQRDIRPYMEEAPTEPLLAAVPAPGKIVETNEVAELGVTEWKLSNGVRVILKPTAFKNDEILMRAYSPGGGSLVPDADYHSALYADDIVAASGAGPFDRVTLRKAMAGKLVTLRPYIGELEEGMTGTTAPADLESFLQLLYVQFTAPRNDPQAFAAWKAEQVQAVRNRALDPQTVFFDAVRIFLSGDHLRRRPTTVETLELVNHTRALEIYRDRFADAGDFTFVFVGNVDVEKFRPLAETYLASLPTTGRKESWKNVGVRPPKGVKKQIVTKGTEPKSFVALTFHGKDKWSADADNDLDMLLAVLRTRLREVLREDMSGVYGVAVWGEVTRRPQQRRSVTVFFGCAPENVDSLVKAVFDEVKAIQKSGIGTDYLDNVKLARVRGRETDLEKNEFWREQLTEAYRFGDDPRKILSSFQPMVDKITSKRVKAAAKRFFKKSQHALIVLKPEAVVSGTSK